MSRIRSVGAATWICRSCVATIAFLTYVSFTEEKRINSVAGPFSIIFKIIEQCPREESGENQLAIFARSSYDRKTKLQHFSGNFTLGVPVDNNLGCILDMARFDPVGGWKQHAFHMNLGPSENALKGLVPKLTKHLFGSLVGGPYDLPLPAGTYYANELVINGSADHIDRIPIFPYGQYRSDFILYDVRRSLKAVRGCFRMIVDVIPKL